jgi:hypothetical protein
VLVTDFARVLVLIMAGRCDQRLGTLGASVLDGVDSARGRFRHLSLFVLIGYG